MPKSVPQYLKEPYARILIPDDQGGYSSEILEFPGCFAEGETPDETMQALERAAESWIQAALDQGQDIPEPFMNQGYGGKVALRLPRSVHRKAAQFAARDSTSLNQHLLSCISGGIGASELYARLANQLTQAIALKLDEYCKKVEEHLKASTNHVTNISLVHNWFPMPVSPGQFTEILQNVSINHFPAKANTATKTKLAGGNLNG